MTPYYKLPKNWPLKGPHFLIIGPNGLISNQLFTQIKKTYSTHQARYISILDADDIEQFKHKILNVSLIPESEVLFVRISDKLISKFPWHIPKSEDKIICLYGIDKPPKDTKIIQEFGVIIRTYLMKEPFRSREITSLVTQKKLTLTPRAIRWLAMSHHGAECLIPSTIERILLTFGPTIISDQDLKSCLHNVSDVGTFDIIDTLTESASKLHLFIRSQKKVSWIPLYWALVSHWRKVLLTAQNPSNIKTHFPWDSQHKTVNTIIGSLSVSNIASLHQTLLAIEPHTKGLGNESPIMLIQHWLYQTQAKIIK